VKAFDSYLEVLNSLDDLRRGWSGAVEMHDIVLAFKYDLGGIKSVPVEAGLGLQLDFIVI
jgi:hypothetical protein